MHFTTSTRVMKPMVPIRDGHRSLLELPAPISMQSRRLTNCEKKKEEVEPNQMTICLYCMERDSNRRLSFHKLNGNKLCQE